MDARQEGLRRPYSMQDEKRFDRQLDRHGQSSFGGVRSHQSGVVPLLLQISPSGHLGSGHLPASPNGGHAEHHFLRRRKTKSRRCFSIHCLVHEMPCFTGGKGTGRKSQDNWIVRFCVFTAIKKLSPRKPNQPLDIKSRNGQGRKRKVAEPKQASDCLAFKFCRN